MLKSNQKNNRSTILLLYLKGFAMGLADIIPGVSGGTIAFITGIYDQLVLSISRVDDQFLRLFLKRKFKLAFERINLNFLLPLFVGIISAILIAARIMSNLIIEYPEKTWAFFFGLIIASIIYISKSIARPFRFSCLGKLIVGLFLGFLVTSLVPIEIEVSYISIFLSGAIAICAMILPGISGSFILLILGKYTLITTALKSPFEGNHPMYIFTFIIGAGLGLITFSKLLNLLLKNYHRSIIIILIGFMIGSLKKIWPWKEVVNSIMIRGKNYVIEESNILPTLSIDTLIVFLFMLLGLVFVFAIEYFAKKI